MPVVPPRAPRVRMPPELLRRQIGVKMRPALIAALRQYAERHEMPVSEIIDDACTAFLNSTSTEQRRGKR